jgi:hypothetical protein
VLEIYEFSSTPFAIHILKIPFPSSNEKWLYSDVSRRSRDDIVFLISLSRFNKKWNLD